MKKLFLTLAISAIALLGAQSANAQTITTGNSNSNSTVINCVNQVNGNCPPANNPGGPTPTPPPGGGGGGTSGGGGNPGPGSGASCSAGIPSKVFLISVVKVGTDSVKLSWSPASGASDYMIEYGLSSGSYTYGVPSTGNVTSFVIGSLDLSKTYYFRVIAVNGCAQGEPSNEVSTAFGGGLLGLSNTSSKDNSVELLAGALALISTGSFLLLKKNA